MRKTITLLLFVILIKSNTTQAQTVYNNGFEQLNSDSTLSNWGNVYLMSVWFDSLGVSHTDPIFYDGGPFYGPSGDAHSGSTALELRNAWDSLNNTGIAGAAGCDDDTVFSSYGLFNLIPTYGTPFSPFAPFNFGFYYKFSPVNGDSAFAEITIWDSTGNQLAEGTIIITAPESNYTLITAPINYFATGDAAFYTLKVSNFYSTSAGVRQPGFGTRLLVDDMGFNFVSAGINNVSKNIISVFPNPSNGRINISSGLKSNSYYEIYNSIGQNLAEGTLVPDVNSIPFNFEKGVYIIKITSGQNSETHKFIVSE